MLAAFIMLSNFVEKVRRKRAAENHCTGITLRIENTSALRVIALRTEETSTLLVTPFQKKLPTLRVTLFQDNRLLERMSIRIAVSINLKLSRMKNCLLYFRGELH